MLIRPAVLSDADRIFALLTDFAVSYQPDRAVFDRHFPMLPASETAVLLVAESDGEVVGYALAFFMLTLYANGAIVELQELMVMSEYRGQGIGRGLVDAVIIIAMRRGAVEVTVPTRRAGAFYANLGFTETAAYFKRKLEV